MKLPLRPLGKVIQVVEEMGLSVTHQYDDIVFVEHSAFMFKFSDDGNADLYFNTECPEDEAAGLENILMKVARENDLDIIRKGTFSIEQIEGEENIQIKFFDEIK